MRAKAAEAVPINPPLGEPFIGQSAAFFAVMTNLAQAADAAHPGT